MAKTAKKKKTVSKPAARASRATSEQDNRTLRVISGVVLALFLLFYPVLTGVPMTELHASLLNWLPSWTLY